ncbi:peptidase U61 [Klebsiella pneumoniae]|uniref:Peptidase U61 n=1 Tax=Klebsiella pneumoniae TaxID=573 RepID=A0A2X3E2J4_KLEPN|nr:peptidase U61 [Klebsiella pneumoniae]
MSYLTDPDIKAVMPPWGGDLAMELLDLIDFDLLSRSKPKWFVGFSDLSTLHFPLTTISGLGYFAWAKPHGSWRSKVRCHHSGRMGNSGIESGNCNQNSTLQQHFKRMKINGEQRQTEVSILTQKTQWKRLDGVTSSLTFSGKLIGGCLEIISRLAGTPFGNVPLFKASNSPQGIILYFENVEMAPCELTRALFSLRLQGWFDNLNGVLIGRSAAPDVSDPTKHNYLDALKAAFENIAVPVLYDVDIGHIPPQISLVNGADATVFFAENGSWVTQQL